MGPDSATHFGHMLHTDVLIQQRSPIDATVKETMTKEWTVCSLKGNLIKKHKCFCKNLLAATELCVQKVCDFHLWGHMLMWSGDLRPRPHILESHSQPKTPPKASNTKHLSKAERRWKVLIWNCWGWQTQHLQGDRSPRAYHFLFHF